jgi:hypothetical protein
MKLLETQNISNILATDACNCFMQHDTIRLKPVFSVRMPPACCTDGALYFNSIVTPSASESTAVTVPLAVSGNSALQQLTSDPLSHLLPSLTVNTFNKHVKRFSIYIVQFNYIYIIYIIIIFSGSAAQRGKRAAWVFCTKLTLHYNHRTGHLKTEHTESLLQLRRHLWNWSRGPAVSKRSELLVAHKKLGQLPLMPVYVLPVFGEK